MKLVEILQGLEKRTVKWNTYFDDYEKHLNKYVQQNPTVLEIGVAEGGSLEMWSKYFVNGSIHGMDLDQRIMDYKYSQPNIFTHHGDQSSDEYWDYFNNHTNIMFDVIIDDGSHVNSHQILTLLNLFPRLKNNGTYVIEDTHTSYWQPYEGGLLKQGTFIETVKGLIDFLHRQHIDAHLNEKMVDIFKDLKSIQFYNSMVVLEKQPLVEMKPYGKI